MIFVTLGTQDKQFKRLLEAVDKLDIDDKIIAQTGSTEFKSDKIEIHKYLSQRKFNQYMEDADIVITGEGRLDGQTAMGKAPVGVARLAKKHDIPVIAFAGSVTKEAVACNQNGIDAFFPILRGVVTLEEAMNPENAKANMTDTVEQVFRLMNIK